MLSSLGWLGKRGTDRSPGHSWGPKALCWMTGPCTFAQGLPGGPEIVGPFLPFSSKTKYPRGLLWDCFGGIPAFLSVECLALNLTPRGPSACSCAWAWVRLLTAGPSVPLIRYWRIHTAVSSQQPGSFFSRLCSHSTLCRLCCSLNKFWVFWFWKLRKIKILGQLRKCGFKPTSITVSPFNWHCLDYVYRTWSLPD